MLLVQTREERGAAVREIMLVGRPMPAYLKPPSTPVG